MDLDNLNNQEVQILINRLKEPKNRLSYDKIHHQLSSLFGTIDIDEAVIDDDDIEYILHIYRGRIKSTRFSIHLRFKDNHQHLVRIDIDPSGRHQNPDGTIVTSDHIHIYSNQFDKRDIIAIPLEQANFPNVQTIVDAFREFENYTNIR